MPERSFNETAIRVSYSIFRLSQARCVEQSGGESAFQTCLGCGEVISAEIPWNDNA